MTQFQRNGSVERTPRIFLSMSLYGNSFHNLWQLWWWWQWGTHSQ